MDKREEMRLPEQYLQQAADLMPEGASFAETCRVARILSQARSQAYEECAKIAEKKFYPGPNGGVIGPTQDSIAKAIRQHSQNGGEK